MVRLEKLAHSEHHGAPGTAISYRMNYSLNVRADTAVSSLNAANVEPNDSKKSLGER